MECLPTWQQVPSQVRRYAQILDVLVRPYSASGYHTKHFFFFTDPHVPSTSVFSPCAFELIVSFSRGAIVSSLSHPIDTLKCRWQVAHASGNFRVACAVTQFCSVMTPFSPQLNWCWKCTTGTKSLQEFYVLNSLDY